MERKKRNDQKPGGRPKKSKFLSKRPMAEKTSIANEEDVIGMRLNKYVAHCGVCSRRQAAELVKNGEISINGTVIMEPGYQIQQEDVVSHKGVVIKAETNKVYILMNKPKDFITTVKDDRNRRTVMDLLDAEIKERIFPVGRLDRATTGLLLLTNDGELAKKLSHPSYRVQKFYHVTLDKPLTKNDLETIREGKVVLEDGDIEVDAVDYVDGKKNEVGVEIHIGRNRIVRRLFESLGYEVLKLDRTYYAGLTKKDLSRGRYRFLSEREVIMLKHFTGNEKR